MPAPSCEGCEAVGDGPLGLDRAHCAPSQRDELRVRQIANHPAQHATLFRKPNKQRSRSLTARLTKARRRDSGWHIEGAEFSIQQDDRRFLLTRWANKW
jgi:hypothetical protein